MRNYELPFCPLPVYLSEPGPWANGRHQWNAQEPGVLFDLFPKGRWLHAATPQSEYEALMQTPPLSEPEPSADNEALCRLEEAEQRLTARERFVMNALTVECLSVRATASLMSISKSRVHSIMGEVRIKMQQALIAE